MQAVVQRIVVVGGNGYIGSAVCKAALARGMQVTSISSSGQPYKSPKGHTPSWVSKVTWEKGDALRPSTYAHLLAGAHGVAHTLGTLLPGAAYKEKLRSGDYLGFFSELARSASGGKVGGPNPLDESLQNKSYERINRDTAVAMCETFVSSAPPVDAPGPRPFVYISAEDVFRPLIPSGYINSKRQAEQIIASIINKQPEFRPVFVRPSLVYHAHLRPMTSLPAALLDLSSHLHKSAPSVVPTPAGVLRLLASATGGLDSPFTAMSNALTTPPIHVEHVADAVVRALDVNATDVRGVVGVQEMRDLIGWSTKGQTVDTHVSN